MMRHYLILNAHSPKLFIKPIMDKSIDPAALRLTQFSHGGG
jgi:hypothetical protein